MSAFANTLDYSVALNQCRAEGLIKNVNTIEDFKQTDKAAMLQTAGRQIWDAIKDGTIYSIPSLLSSLTILSFADLKKYRFTYWFAFPALHSNPLWKRVGPVGKLGQEETTALVEKIGTWRYGVDDRQYGFFLAKRVRGGEDSRSKHSFDSTTEDLGFRWDVAPLRAFEDGYFEGVPDQDKFVAFVDASSYPEHPSWPLRNLLVLIRQRFHLTKVNILCYRDSQARRHEARSIILPLAMDSVPEMETNTMPKVTGWERNGIGKLQARQANLGEYLDPHKLADQAVDLNLKLMKWRISPNLDLDTIKQTSCLLLGAGTLGSYVSRNLMGWGVRKITFIDYGSVSFSNPVRQPLFEFKDALNGGAPKATRAAESLKAINPGVEAEGHVLSVPMLGHPITDESKTRADFAKLKELIEAHDVIFLLMDSRESRWLPTVMGKAAGKIVMNAALGFDTYVVMRHGATPKGSAAPKGDTISQDAPDPKEGSMSVGASNKALGCYFCNDVVVATDVSLAFGVQSGQTADLFLDAVSKRPDLGPAMHRDSARCGSHCICAPGRATGQRPSASGQTPCSSAFSVLCRQCCYSRPRPARPCARNRTPSDPRILVYVPEHGDSRRGVSMLQRLQRSGHWRVPAGRLCFCQEGAGRQGLCRRALGPRRGPATRRGHGGRLGIERRGGRRGR